MLANFLAIVILSQGNIQTVAHNSLIGGYYAKVVVSNSLLPDYSYDTKKVSVRITHNAIIIARIVGEQNEITINKFDIAVCIHYSKNQYLLILNDDYGGWGKKNLQRRALIEIDSTRKPRVHCATRMVIDRYNENDIFSRDIPNPLVEIKLD